MDDPTRDYSVFRAIAAALDGTKQFTTVLVGERQRGSRIDFAAESCPAAIVTPISFDETDQWDNEEDVGAEREGSASITLIVREDDEAKRIDLLDRLSSAVCVAVNGQSLSGLTIPGRTRVSGGQWKDAEHPEKHLILTIKYLYLIDGYGGHDEDEYLE